MIANVDEATEDDMKRRIRTWYQIGRSWSRLATAVGSPTCLCFLPAGANIVPGQPPIYASEYRDLSMSQVNFLGTLLPALRPNIDILFQKELCDAFLRNCPPGRRFQIEDWPDDWIRSRPLDSDSLAKAFELTPDEEALGEVPARR
jgi:hypothetical protein